MKKVSRCENCARMLYTNQYNLCKRCWQEIGIDFLNNIEAEERELEK
jgi:hypothetical protein